MIFVFWKKRKENRRNGPHYVVNNGVMLKYKLAQINTLAKQVLVSIRRVRLFVYRAGKKNSGYIYIS